MPRRNNNTVLDDYDDLEEAHPDNNNNNLNGSAPSSHGVSAHHQHHQVSSSVLAHKVSVKTLSLKENVDGLKHKLREVFASIDDVLISSLVQEEEVENVENAKASAGASVEQSPMVLELRLALAQALDAEADVKRMSSALTQVREAARAKHTPDNNNWTKYYVDKTQSKAAVDGNDSTKEDALIAFDRQVWKINHPGEPFPADAKKSKKRKAADDDSDDEVVDINPSTQKDGSNLGAFPNAKCPITGKSLLDLEDPVEDHKGYVYEKSAMEQFINKSSSGSKKCPAAGTSHQVTLADLRPCIALTVMKRRRVLSQTQPSTQVDLKGKRKQAIDLAA